VSTEAPLVQTLRFDARRSGSPTRGSRQISGKSRNYRAARTVFKNVREKVLFGRRRTLRTLSDGEISSDRCLYCSQRSCGVDIAGVSTWRNSTAAVIKDDECKMTSATADAKRQCSCNLKRSRIIRHRAFFASDARSTSSFSARIACTRNSPYRCGNCSCTLKTTSLCGKVFRSKNGSVPLSAVRVRIAHRGTIHEEATSRSEANASCRTVETDRCFDSHAITSICTLRRVATPNRDESRSNLEKKVKKRRRIDPRR